MTLASMSVTKSWFTKRWFSDFSSTASSEERTHRLWLFFLGYAVTLVLIRFFIIFIYGPQAIGHEVTRMVQSLYPTWDYTAIEWGTEMAPLDKYMYYALGKIFGFNTHTFRSAANIGSIGVLYALYLFGRTTHQSSRVIVITLILYASLPTFFLTSVLAKKENFFLLFYILYLRELYRFLVENAIKRVMWAAIYLTISGLFAPYAYFTLYGPFVYVWVQRQHCDFTTDRKYVLAALTIVTLGIVSSYSVHDIFSLFQVRQPFNWKGFWSLVESFYWQILAFGGCTMMIVRSCTQGSFSDPEGQFFLWLCLVPLVIAFSWIFIACGYYVPACCLLGMYAPLFVFGVKVHDTLKRLHYRRMISVNTVIVSFCIIFVAEKMQGFLNLSPFNVLRAFSVNDSSHQKKSTYSSPNLMIHKGDILFIQSPYQGDFPIPKDFRCSPELTLTKPRNLRKKGFVPERILYCTRTTKDCTQ
ncbi:MAG: glycosyltransferase family 39 protein [Alphaproteobacteria bacterium]|nr:MAG: glycosyltransferase family 39 protein [Alphaproteobacteria bacterium]